MTKLCPRGKAAAKRKFKVYPSTYANAYASKICAGKVKDPSGTKRKDWGPKKAKKGAMMKKPKKAAKGMLMPLFGIAGMAKFMQMNKKKKGTVKADQVNPVTGEGMDQANNNLSPTAQKGIQAVKSMGKFGAKKGGMKVKKAGLGLMMAMGKKNRRKMGKQMKRSKLNILSPGLYGMTQLSDGGMPKNTGSYIKQDIEGESFTNESAQAYYKDLLD